MRLAQLLICICKGGDRARAEGPSRTRNGFSSVGRTFQWFSSFLSRVWSESVKSPSKNVRGGGDDVRGVDAGDVFRSRPEQILQIIRTWRRFPEKESSFFSCRRQILEITQVRKRGLHLGAHFASVSIPRFIIFLLYKYGVPRPSSPTQ